MEQQLLLLFVGAVLGVIGTLIGQYFTNRSTDKREQQKQAELDLRFDQDDENCIYTAKKSILTPQAGNRNALQNIQYNVFYISIYVVNKKGSTAKNCIGKLKYLTL